MLAEPGKGKIRFTVPLLLLITIAAPSMAEDGSPEAVFAAQSSPQPGPQAPPETDRAVTLFLCGDVMTGRGIDQILPHPSDPRIYEPFVKNAKQYVAIAEQANGPIPQPAAFSYIWGQALEELERVKPQVRIINLETAVTASEEYWRGKGINYRMHPDNIRCLSTAGVDICSLANNHILDWGYSGLAETLRTLERQRIGFAGAGLNLQEAERPVSIQVPDKGRVVLFAFCTVSSGVPSAWTASATTPGVALIRNFSDETVQRIKEAVRKVKQAGDIVVVSIHWGGNWGYEISRAQRAFAHKLIDEAGVDLIHGHSSHHPRPPEIYKDKLILYGCGDFINDYEGISGHEEFRHDLAIMYFARIDPAEGKLIDLRMRPLQIRRFRLQRSSRADARWLCDTLNRHCRGSGTQVELEEDDTLRLSWVGSQPE